MRKIHDDPQEGAVFSDNDAAMVEHIKQITAKGNTAEIRRSKDGYSIHSVSKKRVA